MGTGKLLCGVPVGVHGHDVDVGVAEQLVDDLGDDAKRWISLDYSVITLV